MKKLNSLFELKIEIPRIKVGKKQSDETFVNEEALLFAKYLRGERPSWSPRVAIPLSS